MTAKASSDKNFTVCLDNQTNCQMQAPPSAWCRLLRSELLCVPVLTLVTGSHHLFLCATFSVGFRIGRSHARQPCEISNVARLSKGNISGKRVEIIKDKPKFTWNTSIVHNLPSLLPSAVGKVDDSSRFSVRHLLVAL